MTHASWNTIVLSLFWGGIFALMVTWVQIRQEPRIERLRADEDDLSGRWEELATRSSLFDEAQTRLNELRKRDRGAHPVDLPQTGEDATFGYLLEISRGVEPPLAFDYSRMGKGTQDAMQYQVASLKGEATFPVLYGFVREVEGGEFWMRVESMRVRETPSRPGEARLVQFDVRIRSYCDADGVPLVGPAKVDAAPARISNDPTKPLLYEELPANTKRLLEVDRAVLRAVTPEVAYFRDQDGSLRALKIGDEVYLGYLTNIFPETNQAQFTLEKAGTVEQVTVGMEFSGPVRR